MINEKEIKNFLKWLISDDRRLTELYLQYLKSKKPKCKFCNGIGGIVSEPHTISSGIQYKTCKKCKGRGYVE